MEAKKSNIAPIKSVNSAPSSMQGYWPIFKELSNQGAYQKFWGNG